MYCRPPLYMLCGLVYTLAGKYYIHKFLLSELILQENYIAVTSKYFSGIHFPKITYHVLVCDSENYMEKLFENYFLGKSHVSYMKQCFPELIS